MNTATSTPPRRPRPPVDPKIRERRIAVRRAEGRRRLRVLIAVVALVVLLAAGWAIAQSPLLDVDHVIVRGERHTTIAQIEAAAGIHPGDAMVWIHAGRSAAAVEALPYVRHAHVTREWPGTVRITVTERAPVAWVSSVAGTFLVDGSGRVLATAAPAPPGLPQLMGVARVGPVGATIAPPTGARVAAQLAGLAAAGTKSITTSANGSVSLALARGPELRLGDPDQIAVKIRAALAVLAALDGQVVHYVDVSAPSTPVAG